MSEHAIEIGIGIIVLILLIGPLIAFIFDKDGFDHAE